MGTLYNFHKPIGRLPDAVMDLKVIVKLSSTITRCD
jgi:hypothetical protein